MAGQDEGDLLDEVWKLTSKFYLDRSFGGNDWEKVCRCPRGLGVSVGVFCVCSVCGDGNGGLHISKPVRVGMPSPHDVSTHGRKSPTSIPLPTQYYCQSNPLTYFHFVKGAQRSPRAREPQGPLQRDGGRQAPPQAAGG